MIRIATADDAQALLEIYAYYVEHTAITFEYAVPTVAQFRQRMVNIGSRYPYLIAERDGRAVGYAYAGVFKDRPAYDWAVETTVYVAKDARQGGVGRELYTALENALRLQHILNVNACIACPAADDPYLTADSVAFHTHMGYRQVGKFHQCGYKFGRWYDMIWMEKALSAHPENPAAVLPFDEIKAALAAQYAIR